MATYANHEGGLCVVFPSRIQHLKESTIVSSCHSACYFLEVLLNYCLQSIVQLMTVLVENHVVRITKSEINRTKKA